MNTAAPSVELSVNETVSLAAADPEFFERVYFPRAVRSANAEGHHRMWAAFENPAYRFVNIKAARGWAKTTKTRIYLARRIAFSLSRTILLLSASQPHATRTIMWLRSQIEPKMGADGELHTSAFAQHFGLKPGRKWNEDDIEILHGIDERPIWVLGMGITGGVRGINFEDYRPDLIVLDDTLNDETSGTKEQRHKMSDLIFGAVRESLAPASEEPNAKMINLQTPLHPEDASMEMAQDPMWHTVEVPCWTLATMDAPIEQQVSSWPERYPTEELRAEKQNAIRTNKLSIFTREKEVRLISVESAAFKPTWLVRRPRVEILRVNSLNVLAIDPVPPPSDKALAKNLVKNDFEAHVVIGAKGGEYMVRDYAVNRGHDPNWSVHTALQLAREHKVSRIIVDATAYQRTLKWMLEQEMKRTGIYFFVKEFPDRRNKYNRITSTLSGISSQGRLIVGDDMVELISQFVEYGPGIAHDDILDALSMALSDIVNPFLELSTDDYTDISAEDEVHPLLRAP